MIRAPKAQKEAVSAEKKPVEKKAAEKKPAVKKTTAKAVKSVEEVFVQFGGEEWNLSDLTAKAKEAYAAQGHKAAAIKKITLYVKPEEHKAYYVINEADTGSVGF